MRKIDELMAPVKNVGKVWERPCTDETPLMFIPKGCEYVEIDGIRIENDGDFNKFCERLQSFKETEKELDELLNWRAYMIDYLVEKLEVAKLMATYENGVRYPSLQEMIYEDILSKFDKK